MSKKVVAIIRGPLPGDHHQPEREQLGEFIDLSIAIDRRLAGKHVHRADRSDNVTRLPQFKITSEQLLGLQRHASTAVALQYKRPGKGLLPGVNHHAIRPFQCPMPAVRPMLYDFVFGSIPVNRPLLEPIEGEPRLCTSRTANPEVPGEGLRKAGEIISIPYVTISVAT